jgi:hypothetical protein
MSKISGASYIRTGQHSLELTADDLFDRIINLKFIRKSTRTFTIRSDYEPVFYTDNTISFKTCTQKPDIKITYKHVAESVAIEVDIEVTNVYIGDADKESTERMFTAEGDPVQWCIIQMGYRQQFPDWTKIAQTTDLARFWDLNNNNITTEAEVRRGRQIVVQILTGYPKTYPPDRVLYFKGIIGTFEKGLRWNHTADDLVKGYGDPDFPNDYSELEMVLFQFVTRRFIRASVQHLAATEESLANITEKRFKQTIQIYGYRNYEERSTDALQRLYTSAVLVQGHTTDTSWTELPLLENGIMPVTEALKFGVICAVSKTLRSMSAHALYGYGLTKEQAAALRPIPPDPFNDMQDTLGGQLVAIQQHYPFIRWYELTDGSFYVYHEKDTDKDLWSDPFIKTLQKEQVIPLPGIYDMTPSGTRTIRCPFVSCISPMTTVLFQSRFTLGTLVSYFYPPKTNAFLVIIASIEFATVQDSNVMELMCVDLPPHEIEVTDTGEIIVRESKHPDIDETPKVAKMQEQRNVQWFERTLDVVLHKTGATDTDSRWANIVEKELKPTFKPANWPEGQVFSEALALDALKEWNPDYFDPNKQYMKRSDTVYGESIENDATGIGGRTGIKVPWLKVGDKILVRYPFQSEYPADEKVVS